MHGTVYWITGLAGAGKTTIGKLLYQYIKSKKINVILLDGDELRKLYECDDYSIESRKKLSYKYSNLCKMISEQGIDVICCTISMFDDCRVWNKKHITEYKEIYLKVPIDILIERDQKGLYSKFVKNEIGNVVGMDTTFEEPKNSDITVFNDGNCLPDDIIKDIIIKLNI